MDVDILLVLLEHQMRGMEGTERIRRVVELVYIVVSSGLDYGWLEKVALMMQRITMDDADSLSLYLSYAEQ